jgi:hypothetical protein
MEALLEELIRGVGYLSLKVVTLGRYAGGSAGDRLREIALGLVLVAVGFYVAYRFGTA